MPKGNRANLERLLRSAWERQSILRTTTHTPTAKEREPWYQTNLFWGGASSGAAIVLTVIAAMLKDLRWLLILAWPLFGVSLWVACRGIRSSSKKWSLFATLTIMAAVGLWDLNVRLKPAPAVVSGNPPLSPPAVKSPEGTSNKEPEPRPTAVSNAQRLPELKWLWRAEVFGQFADVDTGEKKFAPGGCDIIVVGEVSNSGEMPSIARNWQLTVKMKGERKVRSTNLIAPGRKTLQIGPPSQGFPELSFRDYLPEITATEAIPSGSNKVGFIVFAVDDLSGDQLLAAGNRLTLSFEDVEEKSYKFDSVTTGKKADFRHIGFPGMTKVN
jgi:hypothetical protein